MKKVDFKTTTYRVSENDTLYIDIVEEYKLKTYEAYLYDIRYGIKIFIFGSDIEQTTLRDFYIMVLKNYKDYIPSLKEYLK